MPYAFTVAHFRGRRGTGLFSAYWNPFFGKWLVVVEISATLFQPARSGSHLYSAPLHPVRSRTLSSRSYSTLVGLAPPLPPCFPHLHPYYITRMGICQEVFYIFFRRVEHRLTYCPSGCSSPSPLDIISIPY